MTVSFERLVDAASEIAVAKDYVDYSRFGGSVNYGAPSMEYRFQVAKFLFEVKRLLVFFGSKWPKERSKWSLRCAGSF